MGMDRVGMEAKRRPPCNTLRTGLLYYLTYDLRVVGRALIMFVVRRYCDLCYRSVVYLSVCLSRSRIVLKSSRYGQDFFCVYDSHMILPDRAKIWLISVNPFSANFSPK